MFNTAVKVNLVKKIEVLLKIILKWVNLVEKMWLQPQNSAAWEVETKGSQQHKTLNKEGEHLHSGLPFDLSMCSWHSRLYALIHTNMYLHRHIHTRILKMS